MSPAECEHASIRATVTVVKYAEYQRDGEDNRMAEIVMRCTECGVPFRFNGVPGGVHPRAARCGVAAVQLRAPVSPALEIPPEHWAMLLGDGGLDA